MRVIVCGGRDYQDEKHVFEVLNDLDKHHKISIIVTGGARGADSLAQYWAHSKGIPVKTYYANWNALGKAAGPIRNQRMIDESHVDDVILVAFPGGRGTADMIRRAKAALIEVFEV